MEKWKAGSHGGTYGGGSAIPMAAAIATIDVIRDEGLIHNALERGIQLRHGLREMQKKCPAIGDVRGMGLMVGVEFTRGGLPDPGFVEKVVHACISKNLLLLSCGSYRNVIRWIPPLVVTEKQIEEALSIFEAALAEAMG
jgi:4-aminobutyrate aminotransferase-like enzyme